MVDAAGSLAVLSFDSKLKLMWARFVNNNVLHVYDVLNTIENH